MINKVFHYHRSSKHNQHAFAPGPGNLDWASQPDPFRRYEGAETLPLIKIPPTEGPSFSEALIPDRIPARPLNVESVSQLFFDSLALSAWKSFQGSKWALRVNPSSGNLHPTEGYLICGPLQGLIDKPSVFHYRPDTHGLEVRTHFSMETWDDMLQGLPQNTIFMGLSSIHWREAWKYGHRAYRYCHHDLGHALAAINISCSGLGWRTHLMEHLTHSDLETVLGLPQKEDVEIEVPDCLIAILPTDKKDNISFNKPIFVEKFSELSWQGTPNVLSNSHMDWSGIEEVAEAARKSDNSVSNGAKMEDCSNLIVEDNFPLRKAIHQRRSAVAMDGKTQITRDVFYQFLIKTIPHACPLPFQTISWEPQVHLGLFVHRVDDLPKGLYFLVRNRNHLEELKTTFNEHFKWEKPAGCPDELDLFLLEEYDCRSMAAGVSCGQEIAGAGCFSMGMISAFESPLKHFGPWFYPRLYWECGAIGQVLYLQAEVSGIRSTGIGCFFDDSMHHILGIKDLNFQSLYHFTVGGPVDDNRLTTLPPY
ncbi:MAG: SagB/ThcOx family dehydrogenase [Nitrospinae bacterium]|nr:SagB/ThcOx family dehydrogenase [Nitrospinota bacterium]